ncbi:HSV2 [Candida jiufengensis]|uniref:HSV2 n=1 Tax=Candida jiufengensis TaxID=497108 RepID=UPI0022245246|nr:HSV2 [Candida jiufengensis]KAI5954922.1 HSV2 [Candida jiufengensis]
MIQTSTIINNPSTSNSSTLKSNNFESSSFNSIHSSSSSKMTLKAISSDQDNNIETVGNYKHQKNQPQSSLTRPKSTSNVSSSSSSPLAQQQSQQQPRNNLTITTSNTTNLKILDTNFNQDHGCFAIGHENGFLVYNTDPIDLRVKRNFNTNLNQQQSVPRNISSSTFNGGSGIGHITMLHRTNYLALVGGGLNPKFPENKLIIWDDLKRKISLSLEFDQPIQKVLLSRIKIVVVLKNQIIIYGFTSPPKKLMSFETSQNDFGIADLSVLITTTTKDSSSLRPQISNNHTSRGSYGSVSSNSSNNSVGSNTSITSIINHNNYLNQQQQSTILAFPGKAIGQIQIVDIGQSSPKSNTSIKTTNNTTTTTPPLQSSIIKAHKSQIRNFCLNKDGTLIASASILGTIIRVHCTKTTNLLYEFRRGIDKADITSIKFNHDSTKIAVLSDKYTLHIFNLQSPPTPTQESKIFSFIPNPIIPQYFKSIWSNYSINTSKFHTNENELDVGEIGWINNSQLCIIWQKKKIWEKYSIVEKITNDKNVEYEIVRGSWKSLDNE